MQSWERESNVTSRYLSVMCAEREGWPSSLISFPDNYQYFILFCFVLCKIDTREEDLLSKHWLTAPVPPAYEHHENRDPVYFVLSALPRDQYILDMQQIRIIFLLSIFYIPGTILHALHIFSSLILATILTPSSDVWGSHPTPSNSQTPTECPTIQLSSNTICLEIVSDPVA